MSELPAPLVSAEVDLRDFPYTPMFRARLFGSSFHARVSDSAWRAGVTLWLKSWDQVPAGTLPDGDVDLCRLAELGRDMRAWRRVRDDALHGWFKAADQRLHHRVVAEGVNKAWLDKRAQRARTEAARAAKAEQRLSQTSVGGATESVTGAVTEPVTGTNGSVTAPVTDSVTGSKGREGKGREGNLRDGSADADPAPDGAPMLPLVDPKRVVFSDCLRWLKAATGKPDGHCRTLLGRWCRDHGEAGVIAAFQAASRDPPAGDAVAWVEGILKQNHGVKTNGAGRHQGRSIGAHQTLAAAAVAAVADRRKT